MIKRHPVSIALLASGLAASGAALADESTVTLYGFLNADFEYVKATGGTAEIPGRNRVSNNLSHIGFRGAEPLGGDLKATFQVESGTPLDGSTIGNTWASRNSKVGLAGSFGEVFLGIWETPYKLATSIPLDPFFTNTIAGANGILGNGFVAGGNGATPASFDRRTNNTVHYWTPNLGGFYARVAYAANEEKTAATNPYLWSASAAYENGPLYAVLAYEEHKSFFAAGTKDKGMKAGVGYTLFGSTRLRGVWERLEYEPTVGTDLKRDAWQLALTHAIGPHNFRLSYVKAEKTKGNSTATVGGLGPAGEDTKAQLWALGYGYALSKRTEVYAIYAHLANEAKAVYNLSTNPLAGLAAGQDPQGFGVGFRHIF